MANNELQRAVERLKKAVVFAEGASLVDHEDIDFLLSERAELLAAMERMRGALIDLIEHAEECMARLDYHDAGMLGDEPVKRARAALTTGEGK